MLTGKQKRFLRAKANTIKPIFQVGKSGVHENMITQMNEALEKRELIKVTVLNNCMEDHEDVVDHIIKDTAASLVQVIGNNIVLYKEAKENKRLQLP